MAQRGCGRRRGKASPGVKLGLLVALAAAFLPGFAHGQAGNKWVGKRVITKFGAVLSVGGQVVDNEKPANRPRGGLRSDSRIYKVEQLNGPWLWIKDEQSTAAGWITAEWLIPYDQAIDYFTNEIRANPSNDSAFIRRGNIWLDKKEYDKAIADYDEAIRLDPKNAYTFNSRGNAWIAKKEYDKAIADYDEAIRLDPEHANAHRGRGNAWGAKQEHDKAVADYSEAIRLNPSDANAYNGRGNAWSNKKEYDKTIADYNEAIRIDPKSAYAYRGRGHSWGEKQEYDKAIADYSEAIRLEPKSAYAYNGRGYAWENKREYDKAIADYDEAIRLDPKDASAYQRRGTAWQYKQEYDKAIADYDEAIRLDPKDASAYSNRGNVWSVKKAYDKAIADYSEAIRLDPKDASAYYNRGSAWESKDECDKANADYDEAIRLDPNSARAYNLRGTMWFYKQEYDKAIAEYSEVIRLDPKDARAYYNRGLAWGAKKEYAKAISDYSEAIRLDPNSVFAYNRRAWLWATCPDEKVRDGKKAVESATKACELTEWQDANRVSTLAAAYAETGDFDAAVKWQSNAIALSTSEFEKDEYGTRLKLYQEKKPYRIPAISMPLPAFVFTPSPSRVPKFTANSEAKFIGTTLYVPPSDIEKRFGTYPNPLSNYIHRLNVRVAAIVAAAEPPTAKGLFVAVGLKAGKRSKVWCQGVDGDIPAPLLRTLERELGDEQAFDLKQGPAGFGLKFELYGRKPKKFPEVPDRWRDAASSNHLKRVSPPDDLFKIIWPD